MNSIKYLSIIILLFCFSAFKVNGQHGILFSANFTQIQEELNNNMVFSGPEISIKYNYTDINYERTISFSAGIGGGVLFNRGMMCISMNLTPIDLYYGFKMDWPDNIRFYLGPRLLLSYHLQLYPDLQAGQDYWLTNINLAPKALMEIPYNNDLIRVGTSLSLFGLVSRPSKYRDPYYFSLRFGDILSDLHSDFKFGSFDIFIHTTVSAEYLFGKSKKWSLGYGIDYFQYFDQPELKFLSHLLNIKYNFGE